MKKRNDIQFIECIYLYCIFIFYISLEQCIWIWHELHQEASHNGASCWHSWPESDCYKLPATQGGLINLWFFVYMLYHALDISYLNSKFFILIWPKNFLFCLEDMHWLVHLCLDNGYLKDGSWRCFICSTF